MAANETPNIRSHQLLEALQRLLSHQATSLKAVLNAAAQMLAEQFKFADKVDSFVFIPEQNILVAEGTSDTPMSRRQISLGLERLPLANGGRVVEVFQSGKPFIDGRVQEDECELLGVRRGLLARSHIAVPLELGGERRGVLSIQSLRDDAFTEEDLRFLGAVASWVGMAAHRAELGEELVRRASQHARRAAAEEIITVLAHDMGNHMAPLRARLDLIRSRAEREKHAANLRDADNAMLVLTRLSRLISDLLDVARLEEGLFTLNVQPVNLAALAREVAQVGSSLEVPVELRGEEEMVVSCDPDRIRQVLENLVVNAVKHSPRGMPVRLEVAQERRNDGLWGVVHVVDEGPGIPAELRPTLFERFTQGTSRSHGLGLGLYLAREITEAHGGQLSLESPPGPGAHFKLALPETVAPPDPLAGAEK